MPETGDPVLVTLKGHLLAEEILDDIIRFRCQQPEVLKGVDFSFFQKLRLTQALAGEFHENGAKVPSKVWPMLDALNELRNDLAHKLESTKLAGRMIKFINLTSASASDGCSAQELSTQLSIAIGYVLGFLSCVEHCVKTGKVPPPIQR